MMKKPILILLFLIAVGVAKAQTNDTTKPALNDASKKFMPVDVLPSFPGGFEKFDMFLAKNEKNFSTKRVNSAIPIFPSQKVAEK